jgi:hypothetical protein
MQVPEVRSARRQRAAIHQVQAEAIGAMTEGDQNMSDEDKGLPAFPIQDASKWQWHGMTMRDYFAAAALTGLMSAHNSNGEWTFDTANAAKAAYRVADAMLKARGE